MQTLPSRYCQYIFPSGVGRLMLPSPPQLMQSPEYLQTFRPSSIQVLESRETAEQVLLSSLRKLDKGKRSRTGLELKRGLLIAFTLFKARQILWQYPTPPPPQLSIPPPVQIPSPRQTIYLASEDYSTSPSDPSMLSTLEKDVDSNFWETPGPRKDGIDDNEESDEDDSDSDDIDIDEEDPFDEFASGEPVFPPPFPLIFPDDDFLSPPSVYNPESDLTNLTTVVPGSEAHRNFDQNHPTVATHLSNPLVTSSYNSRKRSYCPSDSPECLYVSPLKRSTSVRF